MLKIKDTRNIDAATFTAWRLRWPDFRPSELDSDDWSLIISETALDGLQWIRDQLGQPIRITCAYRTKAHNERVKSRAGERSQHRKGTAFDIAVPNRRYAERIEALAIEAGFTAIGRYPGRSFIHIDMRPPKASGKLYRWGPQW